MDRTALWASTDVREIRKARLVSPKHQFRPEDFLLFVELKPFEVMWPALGFADDDLEALQVMIMKDPEGPPVISGTGGVRKMRFGRVGEGKRGGVRVCYAYFKSHKTVALIVVYPKNQQDNLSDAEKKRIKKVVEQIESILEA